MVTFQKPITLQVSSGTIEKFKWVCRYVLDEKGDYQTYLEDSEAQNRHDKGSAYDELQSIAFAIGLASWFENAFPEFEPETDPYGWGKADCIDD